MRRVRIRQAIEADVAPLSDIFQESEVARWWPKMDSQSVARLVAGDEAELQPFVIEVDGTVAGLIQAYEEPDPEYRHASLDIMISTRFQGQGVGPEAIRQVASQLFAAGHHRITIDPRADNTRARRAYEKVGFKQVGVLRRYELDPDSGEFRDGVLYDLLENDLI